MQNETRPCAGARRMSMIAWSQPALDHRGHSRQSTRPFISLLFFACT
jgi:hypothetical protein